MHYKPVDFICGSHLHCKFFVCLTNYVWGEGGLLFIGTQSALSVSVCSGLINVSLRNDVSC